MTNNENQHQLHKNMEFCGVSLSTKQNKHPLRCYLCQDLFRPKIRKHLVVVGKEPWHGDLNQLKAKSTQHTPTVGGPLQVNLLRLETSLNTYLP